MASELAVIDRLCNIHLELEKVEGTLNTVSTIGDVDSPCQPSPKDVVNMLSLLADIVSPACEELKAIMEEMNAKDTSPSLPQGRKARVKQKGQ